MTHLMIINILHAQFYSRINWLNWTNWSIELGHFGRNHILTRITLYMMTQTKTDCCTSQSVFLCFKHVPLGCFGDFGYPSTGLRCLRYLELNLSELEAQTLEIFNHI